MAGKGKRITATGEEPTGKEIRLPAVGTMRSFTSAVDAAQEAIEDAREDLGESKAAAQKNHLLPKPFKLAKDLHDAVKEAKNQSTAAEKLAQYLAHFDHYRKHFKLDELANLQGRMFATGPIGEKADGEPARELDEDGEEDPRPRHLRQPGASAAQAVKDLAEQAGATTRPDDGNLDKLGRGPDDTPTGKPH